MSCLLLLSVDLAKCPVYGEHALSLSVWRVLALKVYGHLLKENKVICEVLLSLVLLGVLVFGGLVARPVLHYVRTRSLREKLLTREQLTSMAIEALTIAVAVVGDTTKNKCDKEVKLSDAAKVLLADQAKTVADVLLKDGGMDLATIMSDDATDAIIRYIVDTQRADATIAL